MLYEEMAKGSSPACAGNLTSNKLGTTQDRMEMGLSITTQQWAKPTRMATGAGLRPRKTLSCCCLDVRESKEEHWETTSPNRGIQTPGADLLPIAITQR